MAQHAQHAQHTRSPCQARTKAPPSVLPAVSQATAHSSIVMPCRRDLASSAGELSK